ncbi:MAG: proline--tRNA ligase [Phycisphaeraceae bacterium]
MRWSRTLIPTLRQVPAEAVVPSHQLMLRAGLIQQVASGAYSYLPLGLRVLHKAIHIVREEMDRAGAVEVFLPSLQPIEWWEQTGRREAYGENLFVVVDRHQREQALGPTHEEVITMLVKNSISSYRQLPLTLYQIQTKFRDEFRPRFGVLRSREFQMKDAYSFDTTLEGLDKSYQAMYDAYCRIFERCGIPYVTVEAESGPIGGSASHEFMVPSPTGEDTILASDKGNYAANVEKCEIGPRKFSLEEPPTGELEKVHTPHLASIEDVCKFMKVKPKNMLKTLVCKAGKQWVIGVVRGDHDLNEGKLRAACGLADLQLADENEAKAAGFTIGFVGPQIAATRKDVTMIVDHDAAQGGFWASGANEVDHHVKHFNWKRDAPAPAPGSGSEIKVADIRNAADGDPSPKNDGGVLKASKGIEIGHVFKLGTKYTKALDVTVLDANQTAVQVIMGCYGIGINRILAAALEREGGGDANGIIWPMALAPYQVVITPVQYKDAVKEKADELYQQLSEAGVEVLLDDRDERPGVKFKDADLIGIPLRIVIGDKGLANGEVEFKMRTAEKAELVKVDAVVGRVKAMI